MGNHTFSQVPRAAIPRSTFNRTHGHKTTFDAGKLIPFLVDEVLPGDTFKVSASVFARMATPIYPLMDNLHLDIFFFAVPNRLLWVNWEKFCGSQDNPGDSTDHVIPVVQAGAQGFAEHSLADYFGLPVGVPNLEVNALPFRAYNRIYNEWFRDQNLQASIGFDNSDGPDTESAYTLRSRGKRHDYFTSCLPWPQKGPGVELPLGSVAPIIPESGTATPIFKVGADVGGVLHKTAATSATSWSNLDGATDGDVTWEEAGLVADLSNATAATINSLRQAFQIQKLLERDARGGTRYVELLKSHFGVTSPDFRLQRAEFLGGGSVPVVINPVTQTSSTDGTSPQGNLAAYGMVAGSKIGFTKSFTEHCVLLGLMMVRADLSYQQGVPRMFSRSTRYDFYWPAFANLGEQAVLSKEIYCDGSQDDELVFGYQERWAEYRYAQSKITGQLRSVSPTSLDAWHLAQEFAARPELNDVFIEEAPPVDRVIAVPSQPHFIFDSHIKMECTRPMPTYSVPGLIDHF